MRVLTTFTLSLALLLGLPVAVPTVAVNAVAATPAEIATQVRADWAKTKASYLATVKPYQDTPANTALITQYTAALDKAGGSLEKFMALKLATPATPAATLTPAVDQLAKDLMMLRALSGKATGPLATALGSALSQQNQVAQTALANMR